MKPFKKTSVPALLGAAGLAALSVAGAQAPASPAKEKNVTVMVFPGADLLKPRFERLQRAPLRDRQMSLTSYGPAVQVHSGRLRNRWDGGQTSSQTSIQVSGQTSAQGTLPLWTFDVPHAARDGLNHVGAILGTSPFTNPGTSRIATVIVPLIIRTYTIGVHLVTNHHTKSQTFLTTRGEVTENSAAHDRRCLPRGNDVPSALAYQSPIFQNASFSFGGVSMGDTQYIDAVERASFYQALGGNLGDYHVLFAPVRTASPVTIDVPANEGLAFAASMFGGCGTVQILDVNWFDSYLNGTLLPELEAKIGSGTVPVFFLYNAVLASPVTDLNSCCVLGYHSIAGEPAPTQLYVVTDFDSSGIFGAGTENTDVLSHEMGEVVNDPFTDNEVPPWGNNGETTGCQENLEVGDPLTGVNVPAVTMRNGYTYNLQELAFFSWFFGGQSLGVDGWYSNYGSLTSDAGPVCGDPSIRSR